MKCGYCDGKGKYEGIDGKMHKCGKCNGTGQATQDQKEILKQSRKDKKKKPSD